MLLLRLSKKSNYCFLLKYTYSKINHLQALKNIVLGFFDSLAILGNILKSKIFQYTDTSLYLSLMKTIIEPREITL